MKHATRVAVLSTSLVLGFCVIALARADDLKRKGDGEGFVPLFNGRDLSGWIYGGTAEQPARTGKGYQVKDGVLYCTAEDGGKLFTTEQYEDFVLRFEFKLEPNANNGLAIRSPLQGDPAYVAMELQILDDSGSQYTDLRPAQYHGSIYDVVPAKRGHQKPVGEWNQQEVTVNGRQITVKLNGHTIVDANLEDVKDEDVLKRHPGLQRSKGHVGFLGHGTRVEFRNIELKEL